MKLSFTGETLQEIHQQIIETANYLSQSQPAQEQVETEFNTEEPPASPSKIDGHVVSDGNVWVPVEGRASAFTGVPVEKYLASKESDVDSKGIAYDPAIHTSTKKKNQDGTWKLKPGQGNKKVDVAEKIVEQSATIEIPKIVEPTIPEFTQGSAAIGQIASGHTIESFKKNLPMIMMKLVTEGKMTREYMNELNSYFNVVNLWDVAQDEEKLKQLYKLFIDYQFISGV